MTSRRVWLRASLTSALACSPTARLWAAPASSSLTASAPSVPPAQASRPQLDLSAFQRPSGALLTTPDHRSGVDPYFALKALWLADRLGMDVQRHWAPFAAWMVDHQEEDGRWSRWRVADAADPGERRWLLADADDALLALWLHSVATLGLPEPLQATHRNGLRQAASWLLGPLMDVDLGVYRITADADVHLWMDNIEVWAALRSLAGANLAWSGPWAAAVPWQRRADALAANMRRVFLSGAREVARVSTQHESRPPSFYPDQVVAPFAWLHGWPAQPAQASVSPALAQQAWFRQHEAEWARNAEADYPWGLLAVAAWQSGDHAVVERWLQRSTPMRGGPRWNILEEAAWQGLSLRRKAASPR